MKIDELKRAHVLSCHNRAQLDNSTLCGCFYCLRIFDPKLIAEWCDDNQTAICPYCEIDSIIYDSQFYPISTDFLKQIKEY